MRQRGLALRRIKLFAKILLNMALRPMSAFCARIVKARSWIYKKHWAIFTDPFIL